MTEPYASYDDEELVSAGPDQRNWTGIGIALLVIVAFSSIILTAVFLLSPDLTSRASKRKLTKLHLEDVLPGGPLEPRLFNGTWISESEFVYRDHEGTLVIFQAENATRSRVMSNITFRQYNINWYSLSPDRKYVLLGQNTEKPSSAFSPRAQYFCYNLSSELVFQLFSEEPLPSLQYIAWGPQGSQLVYVYDNNVYYRPNVSGTSVRLSVPQGSTVIHAIIPGPFPGLPPRSAYLWWTSDGNRLAFASFNFSAVPLHAMPRFASLYQPVPPNPPQAHRYPKAGGPKFTVTLWAVDLESEQLHQVLPPFDLRHQFLYLTEVVWLDPSRLMAFWMDEGQNRTVVSLCHRNISFSCQTNHVASTEVGWMEWDIFPVIGNGVYFLRLPRENGFQHVAMVNITTGKLDFQTTGNFDVLELLAHDGWSNILYYLSSLEKYPGERHLFSLTATGMSKCITCHVGAACKFNRVVFSAGRPRFYVLECGGPAVPQVRLYSARDFSLVRMLDTNSDLRTALASILFPEIQTFQVPIGGHFKASVRIYIPPLRSDEEGEKFPLIVELAAGGPGSQQVTEQYEVHWGLYLATARKYVYARVDVRGSGSQGTGRVRALWGRLGTVDSGDVLDVTRYLCDQLPFLDRDKVVVWGQAYGAFLATMVLAAPIANGVSCAVAVAPITNWRYYGAIYTERYMMKPENNEQGYEVSSLLNKAESLKGKKYLLVHGTADKNVHFQHATMLMKALNEKGVLYRAQIYPDEDHDLANVQRHLYRTLEDFVKTSCFVTIEPPKQEQFPKLIFGR